MSEKAEVLRPENLSASAERASADGLGSAEAERKMPRLRSFYDIPMDISCQLGVLRMTIGQLIKLKRGSFIDLSDMAVEEIDILTNGQRLAICEPIAVKNSYGLKITQLDIYSEIEDEEL
mgnify:FL=1